MPNSRTFHTAPLMVRSSADDGIAVGADRRLQFVKVEIGPSGPSRRVVRVELDDFAVVGKSLVPVPQAE